MDDSKLREAYAARLDGNPGETVSICRRIVAAEPRHFEARSLLAVCFVEAGQIDKARPLIEEAAVEEPANGRILLNLSILREAEGRSEDAIRQARAATAHAPDRFETWGRLGDLLGRAGDFEGAAPALGRAVALNPEHPGLGLLLAAAAYETGDYRTAADALDRCERVMPGQPGALRLQTHLARRSGDVHTSVEAARRWLTAEPGSEEARVALAHGLAQREDYSEAVKIYQPLTLGDNATADHCATFAQYLLWSRNFEESERHYRRALAIDPGHAGASAGLARLNIYKGQFGQAAAHARQALVTDPDHIDAFSQLALASDNRIPDEDLSHLRTLAEDRAVDGDQQAIAWFTLGDVYHKRREPEEAFEAWRKANSLKHQAAAQSPTWRYDTAETERMIDRLIELFGELPAKAAENSSQQATPLFIVGMPRSGTTLLDSALAAHQDVSSGGELPAMPSLLNRFLEWADRTDWRGGAIPDDAADKMRASYLRQYGQYGIAAARFVTDKQPLNILSVGLIRHLFPAAPIVHIRRDALETGFSIYRNNFTKSWRFATSLEDIGHFYGQFERLMRHWCDALGSELKQVRYEALVEDFEVELQRICDFAGLDWDPAMLRYFEKDSVVTTLSAAQVRKGPSSALARSSTPYLQQLRPLRDALNKAGVSD